MKKKIALFFMLLPNLLFAQQLGIIPQPFSLTTVNGSFVIDKNTSLNFNSTDKDLGPAAEYFAFYIKYISGISLLVNVTKAKSIEFRISKTKDIVDEGYLLNISPSSIVITASTKAGIVYAVQTLFQTLPAVRTNAALQIPALVIKNYPRFKWRGMHRRNDIWAKESLPGFSQMKLL
jgi:hexosaminidase